jgi:hypothetical protein
MVGIMTEAAAPGAVFEEAMMSASQVSPLLGSTIERIGLQDN